MKNISKYKIDKSILLPILLFAIISVVTLYGTGSILNADNLVSKQIIWYIAGFAFVYLVMTI